ncbi:uncharacterized protein RAG0_16715 [Rhynchosporium agropyri]|uniref:Uncharacterized protein n=1 Tax=Rhynchosporium agropyri TaxID=914238 RepID=A0A1E1LTC7_9HELO|nr:uncharacterized protein RAG0_16715 [Rhynchosporium agropyri]
MSVMSSDDAKNFINAETLFAMLISFAATSSLRPFVSSILIASGTHRPTSCHDVSNQKPRWDSSDDNFKVKL